MKKLLMLSALAMVVSAPLAMAEGGKGHRGPEGKGQHKLEMLFKQHDVNKDGVITKAEFLTTAEERFAKIDVDHNGEVTKEEVKKHVEGMKKKMQERRKGDKTPPPPPAD